MGINSGTTEERVSQAIEKTEQFFQSLGLSTRLSQEKIGNTTITEIENRFNERNAAFGEAKNVTGSVHGKYWRAVNNVQLVETGRAPSHPLKRV